MARFQYTLSKEAGLAGQTILCSSQALALRTDTSVLQGKAVPLILQSRASLGLQRPRALDSQQAMFRVTISHKRQTQGTGGATRSKQILTFGSEVFILLGPVRDVCVGFQELVQRDAFLSGHAYAGAASWSSLSNTLQHLNTTERISVNSAKSVRGLRAQTQ